MGRAETLVCVALFAFTCWYCASAPYNLYVYDEGYFLYESKRIVDGDVFYRDFFNIVAPLAWYCMAAAYWIFGVSMETARTTMAVIHGIIAACMVVACRGMGIRLSIAAVAALSEAAVCYMAVERAAPHWFGTLFCCLIFLYLLYRPLRSGRDAFVVGALVGALSLTQQQRGVAMVWVPVAVLLLDRWLFAAAADRSLRAIMSGLVAYASALLLVIAPVLLVFIVLAGFDNVYVALVRYPLVNYRNVVSAPWGTYNPVQDPYIGPVVKYLSMMVPAAALLRAAVIWRADAHSPYLRPLLVAWLVSIGAFLGVTYVPGYGYLVLVGPIWFTLLAALIEVAVRHFEQRSPRTRLAPIVVLAFALFFALRLGDRRRELNAQWPYVHETPFGRMNFPSAADIIVLDAVKDMAAEQANRELFIYPSAPGLYLMSGTENITRFQILLPGYSSPEHIQEVIDALEARRQPLVVRNWLWMGNTVDPILTYLKEHYTKVRLPYPPKSFPTMSLFQRQSEPPSPQTF